MPISCVRCGTVNPDVASFCRNCGRPLADAEEGGLVAGQTPHRNPLAGPEGFVLIESAADLYYRWEAVGGGAPLLGTEPLAVTVFNGGYHLAQVVLDVRGEDRGGRTLFSVKHEIEDWPRGGRVQFEVPSYELPDPIHSLSVELISAEFH